MECGNARCRPQRTYRCMLGQSTRSLSRTFVLGKTISIVDGSHSNSCPAVLSRLVHVHFLATAILEGILELYSRSEVSSGVLDDSLWQNYDLLLMDAVTLDGVCKEVYHYYDMERQKFFEIPASLLIMFSEISQGYENDDSVWRNARLVLYLSRLASVLSKPLMNALFTFWNIDRKKRFMSNTVQSGRDKSAVATSLGQWQFRATTLFPGYSICVMVRGTQRL